MIVIKINMKIVILSILIAILMYPRTLDFLKSSGENIYIAKKLSASTIQNNRTTVDNDKTNIVFMFDGGWRSVYTEAYGIMKKYNSKASVQVIPSLTDENEYMSYGQLAELYLQGWDLLNHSYSHKENMYYNSAELLSEFNRARQWMKNRYVGKNKDMVVMPYGEINPYLIKQLKDAGYRNIRTSDNIIMLDNDVVEYYPITTINLLTDVNVNEVKDLLTQTFNEPKTVILILHKIEDKDNGFGNTYSRDKLEQIIMFIDDNSDKLQIITYSELF